MKRSEAQLDVGEGYALQRRRILNENSSFFVQEAYRTLRTNISFSLTGAGCKKICVTSSNTREGKSITTLNIAISFAQAGKKVLLIDADMRRPVQARLLVEKADPGLSNVLAGQCEFAEAVHRNVYENLDVLLSGSIPPNPAELLGNQTMKDMLERCGQDYDYIFVDAPPVGVVSDVCVLADHMDGALFLIWQNRTEKDAVARSVRQLKMSGMRLLGFVMNGVEGSGKKYGYQKGYYYERSCGPNDGNGR